MPISIECPTHEQYGAVADLIHVLSDSPVLGLERFYVLLSGLPGFEDKGLSEAENKGNYVRVSFACLLTDLLAEDIAIRWNRVYHFHQLQARRNPELRKIAVHFRDEFAMKRSVHVWARNEIDAIQILARDGYGHAGGKPLFPTQIEKAVFASA